MFQPLKSLNHFAIQRVLGRGGMGIVYLATDERLERPVALKVLDVYEVPNAEKKGRFLHEAQAAASIRHPNVATIYEVGETPDGMPYIAMEYCEGMTLSQLLRRSPVGGREFLKIARQIAQGVAAAHRGGIVHRDIKSANIVLQDDGTVKILDFGLAKRFDADLAAATARLSSSGSSFFGTLPYISPEQAEGKPADQRSDLFSIGVVLYELATGNLPFDDESPLIVLEKIRDAEPAPFEPVDATFPAEATAIIWRLLQKNPQDRYASADDLANELSNVEGQYSATRLDGKISTATLKFGRTVRRPALRKRRWVWIAAAVAALLFTAIGLWQFQNVRNVNVAATAAAPRPIRSLAVLPFRNLSGNPNDSFLSVGLADALVTRLQQSSELQVRPTSAILQFQNDAELDPKDAAAELQVDGVLEGRFISSGNNVRVTLQLTDGRSGYGVWASSVDGSRGDLITLMDSVSSKTSTGLNETLGKTSSTAKGSEPATKNPQAYENYLRARALIGSYLPEETRQQIEYLKKAVELDPAFAAAYADLAIALSLGRVRGFDTGDDYRDAEFYARQAVRLDPNLALAHLALGRTLVRDPERFRESVRENLAALRLNSNDTQALYTLGSYFVAMGEYEKATCVGDRMAKLDPKSNDVLARGYWNVNSVDPEGSLRMAEVALAAPKTKLAGHDIKALAYLMQGNYGAAEREQQQAAALVPEHYIGKSLRAMIAAGRGDRATMEASIRSFEDEARTNHWAAVRVVLSYARIGDHDKAVEWMQLVGRLGNHTWHYFVKHPWLQPLQANPQYQTVLSKMKRDLDDVRDDVIGVYALVCGG